MKKISIIFFSLVLVLSTLSFASPSLKVEASNTSLGNMEFIVDTDEKSEYILTGPNGAKLHFIETITILENGETEIHTLAYDVSTDELLQDFTTYLKDSVIVDQTVNQFDTIPLNNPSLITPRSAIKTNRSLVTPIGIYYTSNFSVGSSVANSANLGEKKITSKNASTENNKYYADFVQAVDAMRTQEEATLIGWLVAGFTTGGLKSGKIISWSTLKTVLSKIAGPVAVASNAVALTLWLNAYNNVGNSYYGIKL